MPDSPVAMFGKTFMERFYYLKLVENGLLHCFCYTYETKMVGFITITRDPNHFLAKGFKRNFFNLCLTMPLVLMQKPSRIMQIMKAAQLSSSFEGDTDECGAVLSFGVLEAYRNMTFLRKTGLRISHDLFDTAVDHFKASGIKTVELLVEPDNRETLLFYHMLGCEFVPIHQMGRSLTKVIYTI